MQTLFGPIEDDDNIPAANPGAVMAVLVPFPVDKTYTYAVPAGMELQHGDYVSVTLSNREVIGVVWGESTEAVPPKKLKSILTRHDLPPMPKVERDFIQWVATYTMAPLGAVLKMALSVPAAMEEGKAVNGYAISDLGRRFILEQAGGVKKGKLSPKHIEALEALRDGHTRRAVDLPATPAVLKGMVKNGLLRNVEMRSAPPCSHPDIEREGAQLSLDQKPAAAHLVKEVQQGGFFASLIDGVTGAGKTEVYFEAVAEALKQDKQVMILLPEIALSNAFLDRFKKRFGCVPAMWHLPSTAQEYLARRGRRKIQSHRRRTVGIIPALSKSWPDHRR